jgi:hypothetical protein
VKFSVVPESSARAMGVIGRSGSSTPGFWAAIAGSSHRVISWRKIPAMVPASRSSSWMPGRLKATLIGEM